MQWMNRMLGLPKTADLTAPAAGWTLMNVATNEIGRGARRHLNAVYPMLPFTPAKGCRRVAARTRRPASARPLRRPRGRGARLRPSAAVRQRSRAQARDLVFQTNAVPLEVRDEAADALAEFAPPGRSTRVLRQHRRRGERERAASSRSRSRAARKIVAVEAASTAAPRPRRAVTWGADQKWYGFPRAPFDVEFVPREDIAASNAARGLGTTAAVIVEPVQGVAGAFDFATEFLAALRARCDEAGALLIFDEVQCGMGRTGEPFAAQLHGVDAGHDHDREGARRRLPVRRAAAAARTIARDLKPATSARRSAAARWPAPLIETVLDVIDDEGLLANVRERERGDPRDLHRRARSSACRARLPARACGPSRPAKDVQRRAARARHPHRHERRPARRAPAAAVHLERRARASACAAAPGGPEPMQRFHDLADFSREEVDDLLALADRLQTETPSRARSPARCSALLFLNPSLRTLASFQAGDDAARRHRVRDLARPWHLTGSRRGRAS